MSDSLRVILTSLLYIGVFLVTFSFLVFIAFKLIKALFGRIGVVIVILLLAAAVQGTIGMIRTHPDLLQTKLLFALFTD